MWEIKNSCKLAPQTNIKIYIMKKIFSFFERNQENKQLKKRIEHLEDIVALRDKTIETLTKENIGLIDLYNKTKNNEKI